MHETCLIIIHDPGMRLGRINSRDSRTEHAPGLKALSPVLLSTGGAVSSTEEMASVPGSTRSTRIE